MKKYTYYSNCVGYVDSLDDLLCIIENAITISRETFMKHVDRNDLKSLESQLGYAAHHNQGMTMASDYYVTYHRSKDLNGNRVYFFKHATIEYIFKQ